MPDMYLGSERSEDIIVLRGHEVSLRDTCGEEMDMIDEERRDLPFFVILTKEGSASKMRNRFLRCRNDKR
jgi:hypothetical protein